MVDDNNNMGVWLNTNEYTGSYWDFTDTKRIKRNAPVSIFDGEIYRRNLELADAIMFN